MKDYLHYKSVQIPLYRARLIIVLTNSNDQIKKLIPEFEGDIYAHTYMANFRGKDGYYCILNFHNNYREIYHGVIAHEACHISSFLLDNRGVKADFNNDEPVAYLIEWLTDEIYSYVNKIGFKPI